MCKTKKVNTGHKSILTDPSVKVFVVEDSLKLVFANLKRSEHGPDRLLMCNTQLNF